MGFGTPFCGADPGSPERSIGIVKKSPRRDHFAPGAFFIGSLALLRGGRFVFGKDLFGRVRDGVFGILASAVVSTASAAASPQRCVSGVVGHLQLGVLCEASASSVACSVIGHRFGCRVSCSYIFDGVIGRLRPKRRLRQHQPRRQLASVVASAASSATSAASSCDVVASPRQVVNHRLRLSHASPTASSAAVVASSTAVSAAVVASSTTFRHPPRLSRFRPRFPPRSQHRPPCSCRARRLRRRRAPRPGLRQGRRPLWACATGYPAICPQPATAIAMSVKTILFIARSSQTRLRYRRLCQNSLRLQSHGLRHQRYTARDSRLNRAGPALSLPPHRENTQGIRHSSQTAQRPAPARHRTPRQRAHSCPEIRLIGAEGENLGVVKPPQAMMLAEEAGLDLVEISPNATPPVCKIMDFGKFKYEQQKREAEARKKQHVIEIKEVKFRPNTDTHDYDVKMRNVMRFLEGRRQGQSHAALPGSRDGAPEPGRGIAQARCRRC